MSLKAVGPHLVTDGRRFLTENLLPGKAVYGETLVREGGTEYRVWNPRRSKLAALLHRGYGGLPFHEDTRILYLGAGSGTTASHLSDIVRRGTVFCVEFSPVAFRKLLELGRIRPNLIPLLADASQPSAYGVVVGQVDVLYQDVAQRDQVAILMRNLPFLRLGGIVLLMVKARSVDAAANPRRIYRTVVERLTKEGLEARGVVPLDPWEKDHAAVVLGRS